jgi:hypothetical protein
VPPAAGSLGRGRDGHCGVLTHPLDNASRRRADRTAEFEISASSRGTDPAFPRISLHTPSSPSAGEGSGGEKVSKVYEPNELAKRVFYLMIAGISVQIAIIILLIF